jgi:hypothetical protein
LTVSKKAIPQGFLQAEGNLVGGRTPETAIPRHFATPPGRISFLNKKGEL